MNIKAHKRGGALLMVIILLHNFPPVLSLKCFVIYIVSVISATIGAMLPDIDYPKSYLGRKCRLISNFVYNLFGHRGFIHSPLCLLLLYTMLLLIFGYIPYKSIYIKVFIDSICIGYASHLVLDMLTPAGIPLLYPFSKKRCRLLCLTNDNGNKLIYCILIFLLLCLM